ncbi:DEAD/DEAH box helicase [Hyphomicrobium sp.]|uniref:DEAD/DEAH box helicase n=1 Tax=Hyphomicrobium sp. TaxID=82 RepID=UPI0025C70BFA|nr:DEAD/DEAH box helicase [Hyphomicrobium sp.]MCC7253831.1 DEAD/DEAH box helicase family protein [Hyphomicrobium sp.]
MLTLRPYQREAVDAVYAYWQKGGGNPLIVLPTAAGKSLVIATLVRELCEAYPDLRIGIVTHVKELIAQNFAELLRYWPAAPAGIYSAGIGRRDTRSRVLFCGIQSVHNKVDKLGSFDVLLVDEAHLIPRSAETTYGKFIARLREETPDMRVVGLTATPYRLDSGRLDRGKDRLFDKIAYEANVSDLIEAGFLSPLVSKATVQKMDVSGVARRGGEFVPGALEIAVNKDWITQAAVRELCQYGADRRAWIVFCAGVKHAEAVRDAVRAAGHLCEAVTGETPKAERDRCIAQFRSGHLRCLTSVGVLTTGFNVPHVDLIALMRPTMSTGLYVQQVGRAFRISPGKADALVLDFAGNVKRHGPVDAVEATAGGGAKGDGEAVTLAKECPNCATLVALAARSCPTCSYLWPERETMPKHEAVADASTSILSRGAPAWVEVDAVRYFRHEKPGSPPSLRAEYQCGFTLHREWVCLDHQGFARQKAETWWQRAAGTSPPRSVDEAMRRVGELRPPEAIQVRPDGRYFSVVGRRFQAREVAA